MICHRLPGPASAAGGANRQPLEIPQPSCSLQWRSRSISIKLWWEEGGGGGVAVQQLQLGSQGTERHSGAIDWCRWTKKLLLCEPVGSISKCHVSVFRDKNTPRCLYLSLLPWQQRCMQILQLVALYFFGRSFSLICRPGMLQPGPSEALRLTPVATC